MRLESRAAEVLVERSTRAFDMAVDDTLTEARAIAGQHARTHRFQNSLERTPARDSGGTLVARIGSPMSSARAKEAGAFITADNAPWLVFNAGDGVRKVKSVRLKPQPVVKPAGSRFPGLMTARAREQGGGL